MSEWHLYERWLSRPKQPASQHLILFRSWAQRKDWKRPRLILVSAQHIFFFFFFFSGVFSGPDGMFWPGGDFVDACRGFTRLSLQLFARLFARRWCIPAEIESWRYLFSCTHVYLCISSNLDQHSRIYRNSLGGGRGGAQYHNVGLCSSTEAAGGWMLVPGRRHWRFPLFTWGFEQVHLPHHRATAAPSTQTNSEEERSTNASRERSYFELHFSVTYSTDRCFFL